MEILFLTLIKPLLIGLIIGIAIGLTGIGGGVLVMPSLIYLLGISPVPAVGTGLIFAFITKVTGIIEHYRLKNIDIKTSLFFTIGSAPATILSSCLVNCFSASGKYPGLDNFLEYLMGSILVVTAILFIIQNITTSAQTCSGRFSCRTRWFKNSWAPSTKKPTSWAKQVSSTKAKQALPLQSTYAKRESLYNKFSNRRKTGCILCGAVVGTLIGSTSIGGGVLVIPILMIFFRLSPAVTVGTSILISVIPAVIGSAVYLAGQNINFTVLLPLFLGSCPGTILGSKLTTKVPEHVLKRILIAAILTGIVSFFYSAHQ